MNFTRREFSGALSGVACFLLPVLVLSAQPAPAGAGVLSGSVANANTRAALEGAVVQLGGTARQTLTDAAGNFSFHHLAPGEYTVVAHYAGLDEQTKTVSLGAGGSARADFALTSGVYQLDAFTITAEREGNAASITRQRNAPNLINVVSLDAYGDVADGNLGNFMMKLPSIAVQIAEGDAVGISLRGAPASMSMTSLDGTQMSSAGSGDTGLLGDRAAIIDRIPSEFIKEIEVTKASTPDMDATGLGGGTKLVTKSAFDFRDRQFVSFQGGYNRNIYRSSNPWTPTAALTLMRKFGPEDRFGVTLSGSYTATIVTRDRVEFTIPDATNDIRSGIRFLDDTYHRIRSGLGAKFEYRFSEHSALYLDSLYSRYLSNTDRYDARTNEVSGHLIADYSVVSRAAIEGGATPMTTARAAAGLAPGANPRFVEMLNRTWTDVSAEDIRRDNGLFLALGGHHDFGETKLTGRATFNYDRYDRDFDTFTATLPRIGFTIDQTSSLDRPKVAQTYGPSILDLSQYTGAFSRSFQHPRDWQRTGSLDLERRFDWSSVKFRAKAGGKIVEAKRTIDSYGFSYDAAGADGVVGRTPAGANDDNLPQFLKGKQYGLFNGAYPAFADIDYGRILSVLNGGSNYFRLRPPSRNPDTQAKEDVYAGYGLGEATIDRLTLLGGLRVEEAKNTSLGNVSGVGAVTQTTKHGDYTKLFPSGHARYLFLPRLQGRISYSSTMNRPAIANLIPTTSVSTTGSGTVTQNNSDLRPQISKNYDASLEYYFNPVGVLSLGVFRKNISDFIATRTATIPFGLDNGFGGSYAGYQFVTQQNLSSARISGYEVSYDQQLRNLPRPFNTLSVFANYNLVHSRGTFDNGAPTLRLFTPKVGNVGFSYSLWRLQLRASYNYTGALVRGANANPVLSEILASSDRLDLNLQYHVTRWLNLSMNVANLFNKWAGAYTINPSRLTTSEVYGTRITLGVNGRF